MPRYVIAALLVAATIAGQQYWRAETAPRVVPPTTGSTPAPAAATPAAFTTAQTGRLVSVEGRVEQNLADDRDGDRHQRFILRLASGQTLLIVHNIDLAPRLEDLRVGETLRVRGEYVWNEQGGLLHWTHRDPAGRHEPGFIQRSGRSYQ